MIFLSVKTKSITTNLSLTGLQYKNIKNIVANSIRSFFQKNVTNASLSRFILNKFNASKMEPINTLGRFNAGNGLMNNSLRNLSVLCIINIQRNALIFALTQTLHTVKCVMLLIGLSTLLRCILLS